MKSLTNYINESSNDIKNILVTAEKPNGLVVALDLTQLEKDTFNELFNDSSIDWGKLPGKQLKGLYNILKPELTFGEWMDENGFSYN